MLLFKKELLYHGSDKSFETIDLSVAKPFKDYGTGFYLTSSLSQALRWAQRGTNTNKCFIYTYKVNQANSESLSVLELLTYDKIWVDVIINSRVHGTYPDYDIIYDRIADNKYMDISKTLLQYSKGEIDLSTVIESLKWKKDDGDQFCFRSEQAISCLELASKNTAVRGRNGRWNYERNL